MDCHELEYRYCKLPFFVIFFIPMLEKTLKWFQNKAQGPKRKLITKRPQGFSISAKTNFTSHFVTFWICLRINPFYPNQLLAQNSLAITFLVSLTTSIYRFLWTSHVIFKWRISNKFSNQIFGKIFVVDYRKFFSLAF
jgi:hypothetical protein